MRNGARLLSVLLLAAAFVPGSALRADAAAGRLDPTFDLDGVFITSVLDGYEELVAMERVLDGRIVAIARGSSTDHRLVRLLPNGGRDTTFGTNGVVTLDPAGYWSALTVQPDGKPIAAAGIYAPGGNTDVRVTRFLADGAIDVGYGTAGSVVVDFGTTNDAASALAFQSTGDLILAGTTEGVPERFAVSRITPEGVIDLSFGTAGITVAGLPDTRMYASDMVVTDADSLVIAGSASVSGSFSDMATAGFTSGGTLDTSYGQSGFRLVDFGADEGSHAVALRPGGGVILAGRTLSYETSLSKFALAGLTSGGALDVGFGSAGLVRTVLADSDVAFDVQVAPDGRIVAGGSAVSWGTNGDFALARYLANGQLDFSFGSGGKVLVDVREDMDLGAALAIEPDGDILLGGRSCAGSVPGNPCTESPTDLSFVRVLGTETDLSKPTSTVLRPRNTFTYQQANLTRLTGTASDSGGSGIARVQVAFRRYLTNGTCANWNGSAFVTGSCSLRLWRNTVGGTAWSYTLPRVLTKSTGSSTVKHYLLMSRAVDVAGNTEDLITNGRNRNQFEVI